MNKICRTCAKEGKRLTSLFTNRGKRKNTVIEDLKFILLGHGLIEAKLGDASPHNICQECLRNLTLSVKFVTQCLDAQKKIDELCRSKDGVSVVRTRNRKVKEAKISEGEKVKEDASHDDVEVLDDHIDDDVRHSSDEEPEVDPIPSKIDETIVKSDKPLNISQNKDKTFHCSYCSRTFTNKFRLKNHLRIHTGERPFVCHMCKKAFAQPNALKCHHRLHTGEKPYKCPIESCGKSFTQNTTLKTHMAALHIGKNVKCDVCDKAFTRSSYLMAHKRLEHLGQRPYACHICPNRYKQKSHLTHHLEVHRGVKYVCPICNRKYSKKWSLQVHSYKHVKEEDESKKLPHACLECEESFARKDKLRAHVKMKHGTQQGKKVKVIASQEEVPAPSNVVEVESRSIILHEGVVKEFDARQYHVIGITEGAELIQEIVIPSGAIFYQNDVK